jgi:hypothetical protein
MNLVFEN